MLRILVLGALSVAVLAFDLSIVLGIIAQGRGVEAVAVNPTSLVETVAVDADYAGAYRVPVRSADFESPAALRRKSLSRGMEISGSGPSEVVYRGRLPGLQYHVSYLLDTVDGQRYLTVTTTVHYRRWWGVFYAGAVRLVQWGLVPVAASRWATTAMT